MSTRATITSLPKQPTATSLTSHTVERDRDLRTRKRQTQIIGILRKYEAGTKTADIAGMVPAVRRSMFGAPVLKDLNSKKR